MENQAFICGNEENKRGKTEAGKRNQELCWKDSNRIKKKKKGEWNLIHFFSENISGRMT